MLARPEPQSREHIQLWLDTKDPQETFIWSNSDNCACGQYLRSIGHRVTGWLDDFSLSANVRRLNHLARDKWTFGELAAAYRSEDDIKAKHAAWIEKLGLSSS
jgi:hypothetical protein